MGYVYDNAADEERVRLASLQENLDPPTRAVLTEVGVGAGWRCWEAGAGAGSVARWLVEQVGPTGRVLATDLDPRLLDDLEEVLQHDLVQEPAPVGPFDLVHARLVLEHLPERDAVLRTLAGALAPGGWLVVEDSAELALRCLPSRPAVERLNEAWQSAVAGAGWDSAYGQRLVPALRDAGLVDVRGRLHQSWNPPGRMWTAYRISLRRLRDRLLGTGLVSAADLDEVDELIGDPSAPVTVVAGGLVSAWGRRP